MKAMWHDFIGKVFDYLTVISRDENTTGATRLICRCQCGKELSVRIESLLGKKIKSCGCKYLNPLSDWYKLIGKKINRWTVLERVEDNISRPGCVRLKCQCECGNIKIVEKSSLMSGMSRSCGCSDKSDITGKVIGNFKVLRLVGLNNKNNNLWEVECLLCGKKCVRAKTDTEFFSVCECGNIRKPKEETAIKALYNGYIRQANDRGIQFEIAVDDFKIITKKRCHYCGVEPSNTCKKKKSIYVYNGLDRIDSEKNYTLDNVVPCCSQCNTIKWDMSYQDFINKIKTIYNHLQLKE